MSSSRSPVFSRIAAVLCCCWPACAVAQETAAQLIARFREAPYLIEAPEPIADLDAIPLPAESRTRDWYRNGVREFVHERLAEPFAQRRPDASDELLSFVRGYCDHVARYEDAPPLDDLMWQGTQFDADADPFVRGIRAAIDLEVMSIPGTRHSTIDAHREGVEAGLPTLHQFLLSVHICRGYADSEFDGAEVGRAVGWFDAHAAPEFVELLTGLPMDSRAEQFLVWHFLGRLPTEVTVSEESARFANRLLADESIGRWVAHSYAGELRRQLGWTIRGVGFANTVEREAWGGLSEQLAYSRRHLEHAYSLAPDRASVPSVMINVTMADRRGAARPESWWHARVLAAEIDSPVTYRMLRFSRRPRWGGSLGHLEMLGREAALTERYDTQLPAQYLLALADIYDEMQDRKRFARFVQQGDRYDLAKRAATGMIAAEGVPHARVRSYRTHLASIAWLAGYSEDAIDQMRALGDRGLDLETAKHWGSTDRQVLVESLLSAVPEFTRMWETPTEAAPDAALLAWRSGMPDLEARYADEPDVLFAGHDRLLTLELASAVAASIEEEADPEQRSWIPLPLEKGLPGWRASYDYPIKFSYSETSRGEPALACMPAENRAVFFFDAGIPRDAEISARIEFEELERIADLGVILRHTRTDTRRHTLTFVAASPLYKKAYISRSGQEPTIAIDIGPLENSFSIVARTVGDRVTLVLNGEEIHSERVPENAPTPHGFVGLWARAIQPRPGRVLFSDIKVRALTAE